jgi:hypothetical protein
MLTSLDTAPYFEGRAKTTRTVEERERFLAITRRYLERAEAEAKSRPLSLDTWEASSAPSAAAGRHRKTESNSDRRRAPPVKIRRYSIEIQGKMRLNGLCQVRSTYWPGQWLLQRKGGIQTQRLPRSSCRPMC